MDHLKKKHLMQEYYRRFQKILVPITYTGFCRFSIKNGRIVEKTFGFLVYNVCILVLSNISACYLLYDALFKNKYLSLPEIIIISYFTVFANLLLCNITFGDKKRGLHLVENYVDIDTFLGPDDTKFMRDIAGKAYIVLTILVGISDIIIIIFIYKTFDVSMAIHIVSSLFFGWLFLSYNDLSFLFFHCVIIAMRARYLNVALMKVTNINPEYVPSELIFYSLFWKKEYDERVTFHNTAKINDFTFAYRMLFKHLQCMENCYKFPILIGVIVVVMGSFVAVQSISIYINSSGIILRAAGILLWSVISWCYLLVMSLQTDMFYRQIEQTKLICALAQLKPSNSAAIFRLTKNIIRTLEVRQAKMSLYGMFFFNPSLTLKLVASTFVYITIQLQVTFPSTHDSQKYENNTMELASDDPNVFKRYLI